MQYLVIDAYPRLGSDAFARFAGSIVGCWIRQDLVSGQHKPENLAEQKLSGAGWEIGRVITNEQVSDITYANRPDGREFYQQALQDGFVANFHTRPHETMGDSSAEPLNIDSAFRGFVRAAGVHGIVSLHSDAGRQWANGVTPDGDEFVPAWLTEEAAAQWLKSWPRFAPRGVSPQSLRADWLNRINDQNMWVGLALGHHSITTFHALAFRDALEGRLSE